MINRFSCLLAVLLCAGLVHAEETPKSPAPFIGKKSQWNGFDKYDFESAGKPATIVVPKDPAPGRPWLWRGEFFGAFPAVDLALVNKGWHVAYLNCSNTFGSPDTMKKWETFYDELTTKHGLAKRPVLLGMSRGGLYVYSWASTHPDKTGLIYGDAPVCDIKSWPGGKGKGKGSPKDWQLFQKVFGFKTEQEAIDWKGNPIDVLEPIVKAKIPIIHVVGDADDVVPIEENTLILKERIEKLGGKMELISKKGVGHHPHSLTDPTPVVEFIEKNAVKE